MRKASGNLAHVNVRGMFYMSRYLACFSITLDNVEVALHQRDEARVRGRLADENLRNGQFFVSVRVLYIYIYIYIYLFVCVCVCVCVCV
jgi:hypothetical protein